MATYATSDEVLTHRDIRLREIFGRVNNRDDVVALLRNLLAHCYEKELPFDDCLGEAVTAPVLRPPFGPGDLKVGDVFVFAFGSGVAERRVFEIPIGASGVYAADPGGRGRRYVSYTEVVFVGTKKEYLRLLRAQRACPGG